MNCLAHGWLSSRHVLVAADRGRILLFEDAELKTTFTMAELTKQEEGDMGEEEVEVGNREVGALIPWTNGFIASYGPDRVHIFEQQPMVRKYREQHFFYFK